MGYIRSYLSPCVGEMAPLETKLSDAIQDCSMNIDYKEGKTVLPHSFITHLPTPSRTPSK
jgi:hypothetical protein